MEALKASGDEAYKAKNYAKAVAFYSQAIEANEANEGAEPKPGLFTNRAAAQLMLLQYKEAEADCARAIALEPGNARAYFRKATALRGLGRLDDAISTLEKGLGIDVKGGDGGGTASVSAAKELRDLQEARKSLATLRVMVHEEKRHRAALTTLDQLIRTVGGNFRDFNILRLICLFNCGRTEEAYNLSNSMMRSGGAASNGDVELLHARAECLFAMGDMENAIKHLQTAVRGDPDNVKVRTYYRSIREIEEKKEGGSAAFKRAEYGEAENLWREAIELVGKYTTTGKAVEAKLHFNRATALSKLKRNEEAVSSCDKAIALDSSYIKAYVRRAEANFTIGGAERIKQTIADYEKVEELQGEGEEGGEKIDCKNKIKQAKVALKRAGRKDFYSILGVSQGADEEEIRKAYKKAALKHHPDRHSSSSDAEKEQAEKQFKIIGEAYECLSDPEKKRRYDSGVDPEDLENPHADCSGHGHSHGGMGGMGGIDPNLLFQMFMQQQMGAGGGGRGRGGGGPFGGHF